MSAFFPLPAWLLRRSDVSWPAKALFAVLSRYTRKGTREAYPAIDTLSSDMCAPRSTVERWLRELENAGLIKRERTGRASLYRLASDPGEMPTSVAPRGLTDEGSDGAQRGTTSEASRSSIPEASDTSLDLSRGPRSDGSEAPALVYPSSPTPSSDGREFQEITTTTSTRDGFGSSSSSSSHATLAEVAWTRVVSERGGSYTPHPTRDARVLRVVAEAVCGANPRTTVLEASARAFWAQRRSPKALPENWLEWVQREASAPASNGVSPAHEFVPSDTSPEGLRAAIEANRRAS